MKQKELAKQMGISKSYLSMILSGQRRCPPELASKLSSQKVVNFEARNSLRGRCPRPLDECATNHADITSSQTGYSKKFITLRSPGTSARRIEAAYYALDGFVDYLITVQDITAHPK